MKTTFKEKLNNFLDILFPTDIKCIFCGEEIQHKNRFNACDNCLKNLPFSDENVCKLCGVKLHSNSDVCSICHESFPPFQIARAPFVYDDKIVTVVYKMKFGNAKYLFKPLAEFMVETYKKFDLDCDVIVPVPLSEKRLKARHYNQAEELAKVMSNRLNLPVVNNCVYKIRETQRQAKLGFYERRENLRDAFTIRRRKFLKGKNVLVVDDVMTTSQTIRSVCEVIQLARPKSICVITLARTDMFSPRKLSKFEKYKKLALAHLRRELRFFRNRKKIAKKLRLLNHRKK